HKWESLFKRRELVHTDAVKEFYAKLTMSHNRKKDVARSKVRSVEIVFDHLQLASILGIPGNNGICEYIKEARRVKSVEMKPFQRFIHFLVMKNVVPHFSKRDTTSYMDLIYMDHLIARRLVNLPRAIMRHMSYVISVKDHELPYGDWMTMVFEAFGVPLVDKKGEELKRYDYFEETFLTLSEAEEEEKDHTEFDWEAVIDEAAEQGESGSDDQFFDAQVDVEEPVTETQAAPAVPVSSTVQQKVTDTSGVDPSCPSGYIPEAVMNKLQADFERARANKIQADLEKAQAENARLLAMLHQAQFKSKP
ncbi:hypothetical protein Dimus_002899, partial [Dionaea muscipula]